MTEKTLKLITTVFGLLILVYFVARLMNSSSSPTPTTGRLSTALTAIAKDSLTGAEIVSPRGRRMAIHLTPTGWMVDSFRADSSLVARLKANVAELRVADLAGRNPDNFPLLGLGADSAWQVTLHGKRDSVKVLVGGPGALQPSVYMRLPDDSTAWDVATGLLTTISLVQNDWRDRAILRVDTTRVNTVVIERDGQSFAMVRGDSAWRGRPGPVGTATDSISRQEGASVLIALSRYDASGFPPDSAWRGRQDRKIIALGARGDTLALLELRGDSTTWVARRAGDPHLFHVSAYDADRIAPKRSDLIPRLAGH